MHESITIAEVGFIVNVSGSRIATPFGPPSPGSTPTKMPSTRPTIMSESVFAVSRTSKPWNSSPSASTLEPQPGFERAFGHDHVESDIEGDEHRSGEDQAREERFPPRDSPDGAHEARDQQKARHVESQPLREQAEQEGGHEHLQHPPQLVAVDEGGCRARPCGERLHQAEQACSAEQQGKVEGEVARLRSVGGPAGAAPPVIPCHE